jgi:hypothetical protein
MKKIMTFSNSNLGMIMIIMIIMEYTRFMGEPDIAFAWTC